jgi:hypothetical protein
MRSGQQQYGGQGMRGQQGSDASNQPDIGGAGGESYAGKSDPGDIGSSKQQPSGFGYPPSSGSGASREGQI